MIDNFLREIPIEQFDGSPRLIEKYDIHVTQSGSLNIQASRTHRIEIKIGMWVATINEGCYVIVDDTEMKKLIWG
ncbi:hypothetical protein ACPBEI_07350 [Latilactobacillus sakei]